MSELHNDGGPAFPVPAIHDPGRDQVNSSAAYTGEAGMTLRDYFAAKAIAPLTRTVQKNGKTGPDCHEDDFIWVARRAYMLADAMLKAREA